MRRNNIVLLGLVLFLCCISACFSVHQVAKVEKPLLYEKWNWKRWHAGTSDGDIVKIMADREITATAAEVMDIATIEAARGTAAKQVSCTWGFNDQGGYWSFVTAFAMPEGNEVLEGARTVAVVFTMTAGRTFHLDTSDYIEYRLVKESEGQLLVCRIPACQDVNGQDTNIFTGRPCSERANPISNESTGGLKKWVANHKNELKFVPLFVPKVD